MERAKIKISEKKIFRSQETPNIPQKNKKINKAYFCIIILKKIFESVIWLEKMTVLCNAVKIIFFLQYLSKTPKMWVGNIERLCRIMQIRTNWHSKIR